MIGEVLSNRYEIVAKIGDGGMALVYSAKDILLNRLVAVKVLRDQYASDREFIERFHREAQALPVCPILMWLMSTMLVQLIKRLLSLWSISRAELERDYC